VAQPADREERRREWGGDEWVIVSNAITGFT